MRTRYYGMNHKTDRKYDVSMTKSHATKLVRAQRKAARRGGKRACQEG